MSQCQSTNFSHKITKAQLEKESKSGFTRATGTSGSYVGCVRPRIFSARCHGGASGGLGLLCWSFVQQCGLLRIAGLRAAGSVTRARPLAARGGCVRLRAVSGRGAASRSLRPRARPLRHGGPAEGARLGLGRGQEPRMRCVVRGKRPLRKGA